MIRLKILFSRACCVKRVMEDEILKKDQKINWLELLVDAIQANNYQLEKEKLNQSADIENLKLQIKDLEEKNEQLTTENTKLINQLNIISSPKINLNEMTRVKRNIPIEIDCETLDPDCQVLTSSPIISTTTMVNVGTKRSREWEGKSAFNMGNYFNKKKDYENMKKYYLMAIEKGNLSAMSNLGYYYHKINDKKNMKKYYMMAIDKGHTNSMVNLGFYYQQTGDYEKMKKYFLMAIEKKNVIGMFKLGKFYKEIGDVNNMIQFYQMASELGHDKSMNNLGNYYLEKKDYENMKKYYLMAIEHGNAAAMNNLGLYYKNIEDYETMKKYFTSAVEAGNKTAMLNLINYFESNDVCDICFEKKSLLLLSCKHSLCSNCASKLDKCPFCMVLFYNKE